MRVRLTVKRHGLPPASVLWTFKDGPAAGDGAVNISHFIEQVNEVIPLEADAWGLEDYVVEVHGFECLHFSSVWDVLKDDDRVCIRPLGTADLRVRKVSGRHQISEDGKHLIDGVAFGRPFLRKASRPALKIPARKRIELVGSENVEMNPQDLYSADAVVNEQVSPPLKRRKVQAEAPRRSSLSRPSQADTSSRRSSLAVHFEPADPSAGSDPAAEESETDEDFVPEKSSSSLSSNTPDSSPSPIPVTPPKQSPPKAPGTGLTKTQKRNERRKNTKTLQGLVASGVLPPGSTLHDLQKYQHSRDSILTKPASDQGLTGSTLINDELSIAADSEAMPVSDLSMPLSADLSETVQAEEAQNDSNIGLDLVTAVESPREGETRRPRLDVATSKRMVFGSLGLRTPKNKREAGELQAKLTNNIRAQPVSNEEDDWRKALTVKAVECCVEGVEYTEPPFPFQQRWDPKQDEYRALGTALHGQHKRKRKPQNEEEYHEEVDTSHIQHDDLPSLPADITTLPDLTPAECKSGAVVTFKNVEMSASTNWQPNMTDFRTARVLEVEDGETLVMQWAYRDQPDANHVYDEETGERVYEKFEMPGYDEGSEDPATVRLQMTDLLEAKLLQPAPGGTEDAKEDPKKKKRSKKSSSKDEKATTKSKKRKHKKTEAQ